MPRENPAGKDEDPFASFVDILKEMVSAGYGFDEIIQTLKDLGLSEGEAGLLVELNVEKQLPSASGKIEKLVKERVEKHIQALRQKLKRKVESRQRRLKKVLDLLHSQVSKALALELPEKQSVFERRYYNYLIILNQAEIEKKELIAFLMELKDLKMTRKTKAKVLNAIRILNDL